MVWERDYNKTSPFLMRFTECRNSRSQAFCTSSFCILQAIKNWRCRRPGNEARYSEYRTWQGCSWNKTI